MEELSGHELYALCDEEYAAADAWLEKTGLSRRSTEAASALEGGGATHVDTAFGRVFDAFVDTWEAEAGLETFGRPWPT